MREGDAFENLLNGTEYVVKNIVNNMVVLQSRSGDSQILTAIETVETESFFRKIEKSSSTALPIRNQ